MLEGFIHLVDGSRIMVSFADQDDFISSVTKLEHARKIGNLYRHWYGEKLILSVNPDHVSAITLSPN